MAHTYFDFVNKKQPTTNNKIMMRFQDLDVYRIAERLADEIWEIIKEWQPLAQETIGKEIIAVFS